MDEEIEAPENALEAMVEDDDQALGDGGTTRYACGGGAGTLDCAGGTGLAQS